MRLHVLFIRREWKKMMILRLFIWKGEKFLLKLQLHIWFWFLFTFNDAIQRRQQQGISVGIYVNGSSALLSFPWNLFAIFPFPYLSITTTCVRVYINFKPMRCFAESFRKRMFIYFSIVRKHNQNERGRDRYGYELDIKPLKSKINRSQLESSEPLTVRIRCLLELIDSLSG